MSELELCCRCDDPTGRAGRADDSLFTDNDLGPYCRDCFDDPEYWRDLYVGLATVVEAELRD